MAVNGIEFPSLTDRAQLALQDGRREAKPVGENLDKITRAVQSSITNNILEKTKIPQKQIPELPSTFNTTV